MSFTAITKKREIISYGFILIVFLLSLQIIFDTPKALAAENSLSNTEVDVENLQQNIENQKNILSGIFNDKNNYTNGVITLIDSDLKSTVRDQAKIVSSKIKDLEDLKTAIDENNALYNDKNNYTSGVVTKDWDDLTPSAQDQAQALEADITRLGNNTNYKIYDTTEFQRVNQSWNPYATGPSVSDLKRGVNDIQPEVLGNTNSGMCVIWDFKWTWTGPKLLSPDANLENCFSQFFYFVLYMFSMLVGLAGKFLNVVIEYTLVNMKTHLSEIGAIDTAWMAIRDLVNISFIFILLYISIQTILGIGEHGVKHVLVKLIIVAMLINFSMFFTKVVIDATNMLAFEFYAKIQPANGGGFGDAVMNTFRLQTIYNTTSQSGNVNARNFAQNEHPFIVFVMGIILIIVALGVVLGGSMIFIKRYTTLIMLLIIAPIGFAGMILHSTEHYAKEWWNKLLSEAMAAPVFMIMMWIVFSVVNNEAFKKSVGLTQSSGSFSQDINNMMFSDGASNETVAGIILNFAIVISLFSAVLIACEKIGASGAGAAMKIAGGVKNAAATIGSWAGKNTFGAGAYNLLEKTNFGMQTLKQLRHHRFAPVRVLGRAVVGGLQKMGEGHHHDVGQDQKALQDTLHELRDDPKAQAEFLTKMFAGEKKLGGLLYPHNQKVVKYLTSEMKEAELASIAKYMEKDGSAAGMHASGQMLSYLGKEKQKRTREFMDNRISDFDKVQVGDAVEQLRQHRQFKKTKTVSYIDDHGEIKTLKGEQAEAFMKSDQIKEEETLKKDLKKMFNTFSERQKTEIFGTLTKAEQDAIAEDDDFIKMITPLLKDYKTLENTMKPGLSSALEKRLGAIGTMRAKRNRLYNSIQQARKDGSASLAEMEQEWANLENFIPETEYRDSQERPNDATIVQADRNWQRFMAGDPSYSAFLDKMTRWGYPQDKR